MSGIAEGAITGVRIPPADDVALVASSQVRFEPATTAKHLEAVTVKGADSDVSSLVSLAVEQSSVAMSGFEVMDVMLNKLG